jgi:hypothetical protein
LDTGFFAYFNLLRILAFTSGDSILDATRTGSGGTLQKRLRTCSKGSTA